MATRYEWDTSDADRELRRLQDGFDLRDHAGFESVLYRAYVHTVQDVHVITGSLAGSSDADVDSSGSQDWEGHISYGGESTGPINPVKYAVYERGKRLGRSVSRPKEAPYHTGDHDFMRRTYTIDDQMMDVLVGFFERGHSTAAGL